MYTVTRIDNPCQEAISKNFLNDIANPAGWGRLPGPAVFNSPEEGNDDQGSS